ncbi:MAG: hypothetical protein K0S74_975 [Chlamydiales bacterium]|jgi:hypothetical protein|nr:hypothetical protein [Chlamydiales bacterium]
MINATNGELNVIPSLNCSEAIFYNLNTLKSQEKFRKKLLNALKKENGSENIQTRMGNIFSECTSKAYPMIKNLDDQLVLKKYEIIFEDVLKRLDVNFTLKIGPRSSSVFKCINVAYSKEIVKAKFNLLVNHKSFTDKETTEEYSMSVSVKTKNAAGHMIRSVSASHSGNQYYGTLKSKEVTEHEMGSTSLRMVKNEESLTIDDKIQDLISIYDLNYVLIKAENVTDRTKQVLNAENEEIKSGIKEIDSYIRNIRSSEGYEEKSGKILVSQTTQHLNDNKIQTKEVIATTHALNLVQQFIFAESFRELEKEILSFKKSVNELRDSSLNKNSTAFLDKVEDLIKRTSMLYEDSKLFPKYNFKLRLYHQQLAEKQEILFFKENETIIEELDTAVKTEQ